MDESSMNQKLREELQGYIKMIGDMKEDFVFLQDRHSVLLEDSTSAREIWKIRNSTQEDAIHKTSAMVDFLEGKITHLESTSPRMSPNASGKLGYSRTPVESTEDGGLLTLRKETISELNVLKSELTEEVSKVRESRSSLGTNSKSLATTQHGTHLQESSAPASPSTPLTIIEGKATSAHQSNNLPLHLL